jgi:Sigma-70, region 4
MNNMPHPEVEPAQSRDWQPLLDRELNRLPEKYRAAIVLCDLEGRTRKDAARLLKVPEGTLSSRLATGRQMLAKRLTQCGVALSGGALAVALSQGAASAEVSASLVNLTAKAAVLVAAGQVAAVSTPVVVLMQGVMKTMLMKKLRLGVGAVLVLVALGVVGFSYQAGGGSGAVQAAPPDKPLNELDALRKENELLKLNLQVVLEKVRAQETELHAVRKDLAASEAVRKTFPYPLVQVTGDVKNVGISSDAGLNGSIILNERTFDAWTLPRDMVPDAAKDADAAIKALREAKDKEGQRRAAEALDKAMKKLRQQLK